MMRSVHRDKWINHLDIMTDKKTYRNTDYSTGQKQRQNKGLV
jgi:hypothetical protein